MYAQNMLNLDLPKGLHSVLYEEKGLYTQITDFLFYNESMEMIYTHKI